MMGTFSILAMSKDRRLMGVAVASGSTAVGSRVPHVMPGVGVAATQAYTYVAYGTESLKLLANGLSPKQALEKLLAYDLQREMRQVAVMNFAGGKAVFTGAKAPKECGEIVGEDYVVIGNLLKSVKVLESMAASFEKAQGNFALKLLKALKAGSESGGDKRGEKSAAIKVVDGAEVLLSLKVDESPNPLQELMKAVSEALIYHQKLKSELY
ncbi:MAG: DUF1028 domain-containing protein [Candidatus Bathyarchaeota archaeon]|nr:DUF1028 domain-containing protein [Candidatus Bathyarchaeota archaeon]